MGSQVHVVWLDDKRGSGKKTVLEDTLSKFGHSARERVEKVALRSVQNCWHQQVPQTMLIASFSSRLVKKMLKKKT